MGVVVMGSSSLSSQHSVVLHPVDVRLSRWSDVSKGMACTTP